MNPLVALADGCLDSETIGAFLAGRLEPVAMGRIDAHAARCVRCRELIAGRGSAVQAKGAPPSHLPTGRRIGALLKDKWRLDALVGIGGMAEVYAATHRNGKKVAVKVLLPQLAIDAELCRRFVQEGYIANHIGHPGVVAVHDDDLTDDGAPFLVMDLLEGECIAETMGRGRMPVVEAVRIAHSVLETLSAAHAKGVLHRDVKPGNVFVTRSNGVKLLDFGIARMEAAGPRTMTGATMGTPAYMPPEQARGLMRDVDARSDVWAVGATLFGMLTGANVRVAETTNELLAKAMMQPVAGVREVAPWLPPSLAAIVDKALAFEKGDRYPSAQEMAAALAALSPEALREDSANAPVQRPREETLPAFSAPAPAWTQMFGRRKGMAHRSTTPIFIAAGALAVVALIVIIVSLAPSRRAIAPPDPAATAATAATAAGSTVVSTATAPTSTATTPHAAVAPPPNDAAVNVEAPALSKGKKPKAAPSARPSVSAPAPPAASAPPSARGAGDPFDRRL